MLNPSGAMRGDNTGNCRFRMSGGEIRNCSSRIRGGGALLAYTASAVQVDITGGKITDCTALENASSGGIYLYVNSSSARINLSGVTISGCKAAVLFWRWKMPRLEMALSSPATQHGTAAAVSV